MFKRLSRGSGKVRYISFNSYRVTKLLSEGRNGCDNVIVCGMRTQIREIRMAKAFDHGKD